MARPRGANLIITLAAVITAALLLSVSKMVLADNTEVQAILAGAYGETLAAEAHGIIGSLELSDEEIVHFRETVELFRENSFSDRHCLDYVNLAYGLTKADISLEDLASKVREGVAKGARPERIMIVIDERVGWLKSARVVVLSLENEGVAFLDKQMSYRVLADYLARGVSPDELSAQVLKRELDDYPALENVIR